MQNRFTVPIFVDHKVTLPARFRSLLFHVVPKILEKYSLETEASNE